MFVYKIVLKEIAVACTVSVYRIALVARARWLITKGQEHKTDTTECVSC